jgi:hypothetical protein
MHAFEVGEDDLPVEAVVMHAAGVFHDGISHGFPIISANVTPAARTCLCVRHIAIQQPGEQGLLRPPPAQVKT